MILRQGNPNRICIHHSAVSPGANNLQELEDRLSQYEITHSKKSWAGNIKTPGEHGHKYLEYHIAVAKDGTEVRCQEDKYVLYHAGDNFRGKESFNLHGIAVLIDGNYENETPTDAQKETVARIVARFEKEYNVSARVRGHKETSKTGTACPGRNIGVHDSGWMKSVISRANKIIQNNEPNITMTKFSLPVQVDTKFQLHPKVGVMDIVAASSLKLQARFSDGTLFERVISPDQIEVVDRVSELQARKKALEDELKIREEALADAKAYVKECNSDMEVKDDKIKSLNDELKLVSKGLEMLEAELYKKLD